MKLWMDVMRDLESVMNDHERILDAWAEGGVDGVVFGPLVFGTSKMSKDAVSAPTGDAVAEAYDPNPAVYARLGVEPPRPPEHKLPEKRVLLEKTMLEWNPGICVADTLDVVEALFGIVLPGVGDDMLDFESALNPEFFEQVVTQETRRALASVDDPERIVPWLDTGRFPHDGDPMSARDLKMLLDAAEAAGLRRFNYHHQGNLSPGEWAVISDRCGTRWDPRKSDYEPRDELVL